MEKHAKFIGPLVMTFMVVFFVTGFVTWLNVGLSDDFFRRWIKGWLLGWPIAALAVITLAPLGSAITRVLVCKLFQREEEILILSHHGWRVIG